MSLLSKALSIAPQRKNADENVSDEILELAVAYTRHEVTQGQVSRVLAIKEGAVQSRMRGALASAVRSGKLVLRK